MSETTMLMDVEMDALTAARLGEVCSACGGAMRENAAEILGLFLRASDALIPFEKRAAAWAKLEDLRRKVIQEKEGRP